MPANDNFASATTISGASGSTTGSNTGAGVQSGEPGYYQYAPGPSTPQTRAVVGPYATVWYAWTAPSSDNFYFSTRDLSGGLATNFASTIQVFTGSSVGSLTRVTLLMDQSAGDGNGADNGASIAFAATSGTTYYLQVGGRAGAAGNFTLRWGKFDSIQLGGCTGGTVQLDTKCTCMASVQIADLTTDNYTAFGSFAAVAGNYVVRLQSGIAVGPGCSGATTNPGGQIVVDNGPTSNSSSTRWVDYMQNNTLGNTGSYASGQLVAGSTNVPGVKYTAFCGAAIALKNVPAMNAFFDPGGFIPGGPYWDFSPGGSPPPSGTWYNFGSYSPGTDYFAGDYFSSGGPIQIPQYATCIADVLDHYPGNVCTYWQPLTSLNVPASTCDRVVVPHPNSGAIGIVNFSGGYSNTAQNPTYQLLYYPMDNTVLNSSRGFAMSGSGTSWTITFNIQNLSDQIWDNVTIALQNSGGVSGASAANTGISLAANTASGSGSFTFNATPGLVTATIQLSRNGHVACTLSYPLYPVAALTFLQVGGASGLNVFERTGCSPKTWVQELALVVSWPPNGGAIPSGWGDTMSTVFSIASGPATLTNDQAYNNCASVASVSTSGLAWSGGDAQQQLTRVGIQVTGVVQSVPIQCTLIWNCASGNISLPTFTQTLSIPAT